MRELTIQEREEASGGILPFVVFGLAVAGKAIGGGGVAGWAVGSASLIIASYQLAEAYGPSRRRIGRVTISGG